MTKFRRRSRVGSKGQVVIVKELRKRHGIEVGGVVEQVSTQNGVLLVPLQVEKHLRELDDVAKKVGETWPKRVSSVEAIRQDRGSD